MRVLLQCIDASYGFNNDNDNNNNNNNNNNINNKLYLPLTKLSSSGVSASLFELGAIMRLLKLSIMLVVTLFFFT